MARGARAGGVMGMRSYRNRALPASHQSGIAMAGDATNTSSGQLGTTARHARAANHRTVNKVMGKSYAGGANRAVDTLRVRHA